MKKCGEETLLQGTHWMINMEKKHLHNTFEKEKIEWLIWRRNTYITLLKGKTLNEEVRRSRNTNFTYTFEKENHWLIEVRSFVEEIREESTF